MPCREKAAKKCHHFTRHDTAATTPIGFQKEVRSPMDNRELAALHSKLVIYRNGLQTAKAKGDLDKARQWLEGIATLKRKIAHSSIQPPQS